MTQPTLIHLHPNEYIEGFAFVFPFVFNLDRCMGSCNTLNNLFNKVCIPNKTGLNLSVFNMITGINESKILTKDITCKCKCKFDGRKCNSNQKWNKCECECIKCIMLV